MHFFVYCGGSTSHVLQLIQTGFPPIERLITYINQKRVFLEKADQSNNLIKRLIAKEQYLDTRDNITNKYLQSTVSKNGLSHCRGQTSC